MPEEQPPGPAAGCAARSHRNRRNAARSTGPVTAAGKAKMRFNALRHGLCLPPLDTPARTKEAAGLAALIAGAAAGDPQVALLAGALAEKILEIRRIRAARRSTLERLDAEREGPARPSPEGIAALTAQYGEARVATYLSYLPKGWPGEAGDTLPTLAALRRLAAIDRYEERALSARRKLTRRLEAARAGGADV